jgi:hypothetical protein
VKIKLLLPIAFRFDFDNDKLLTVDDLQLLMIHIIPCINNNNDGKGHSQNLDQRLYEHHQVKDYLNATISKKEQSQIELATYI